MPQLMLIWISTVTSECLEICLLWRVARAGTLREYFYFCAYIASSLTTLALPIVYVVDRPSYNYWYWPIQFVTLLLGCGVVLEIFRHVLSPYPGAERFAKIATIAAFAAVFGIGLIFLVFHLEPSSGVTGIELERNVRALQAVLLFSILAVIFRYAIPVGRNILGMMIGYGLYIFVSLTSRAVEAYAGAWLRAVWIYIQPFAFVMSLAIWLVAMWSYHPNPVQDPPTPIQEDYIAMASRTRRALHATRSYIGRVARL